MPERAPRPIPGRVLAALIAGGIVLAAVTVWLLLSEDPDSPATETVAEVDSTIRFHVGSRFQPVEAEVEGFEQRIASVLVETKADATPIRRAIQVRAFDVHWRDRAGRPFLLADMVAGQFDPTQVASGRVVIVDVVLDRPRALLVQPGPEAEWNYVSVLGLDGAGSRDGDPGRNAGGDAGGGLFLEGMRVRSGTVEIRLPARTFVLEDLAAALPGVEIPGGARPAVVRIAELTSTFVVPEQDRRMPLAARDATIRFPGGRVDFALERVTLGETKLTQVDGIFDSDLPGLGIRATGLAPGVRLADVQFVDPRLPDDGTASFEWTVEPAAGGNLVRIEGLALRTGESAVAGALAVIVGGEDGFSLSTVDLRLDPLDLALIEPFAQEGLPVSGLVRGTVRGTGEALAFDVDATLRAASADSTFRTRVTGLASITADGFRLSRLEANLDQVPLATLREFIPGLPLGGLVSGRITLLGAPGDAPLNIDVSLDLAGGSVVLTGVVNLTGATPAYDLTGRLVEVDLQRVIEPDFPPVRLNAEFTLNGRGVEPATVTAALDLTGRFSGWYTGEEDRLIVRASAASGVLEIAEFQGSMGPIAAAVEGSWSLVDARTTEGIRYRVLATNLAPLGPYLPLAADSAAGGSADVSGVLRGSLDRPAVEGELRLDEFRWGGWGVSAAEGTYAYVASDSVPQIQLDLGGRGIDTPEAGSFEAATIRFGMTPPTFGLVARVDRVNGGIVEVEAEGSLLEGGAREAMLRRFVVDLGEDRWSLAGPATIRWGGVPGIRVENLIVTDIDDPDRFVLEGTVYPLDLVDVRFEFVGLPTADVAAMLGRPPRLYGDLSAQGRIRGGPTPEVEVDFQIIGGGVGELAFTDFEGTLAYADQRAVGSAMATLMPAGQIRADVVLPVRLALGDSIEVGWAEAGTLDGTITADSLPLTIFEGLLPRMEQVEGYIAGTAELGGTVADPSFEGSARLASAALTVPAFDRRFTEIEGRVLLRGETMFLEGVQLRSDGYATVSGQIAFEELSEPIADLSIRMDGFRPVGVEGDDPMAVWGTVNVDGPLEAVTLSGDIRINEGTIELPELGQNRLGEDFEEFMETGGLAEDLGVTAEPSFLERLSVNNLVVTAGQDAWFEIPGARALLSGELTVFKTGDELRIFGTLQGEHGTYTLRAGPALVRRFEIRSAQIRFFGSPEPNPAIDIIAARTIYTPNGERVEILVNVRGTVSRPQLALTTPEGAQIPQSELVNYLLFGQSSVELGALAPQNPIGAGTLLGTTLGGSLYDAFGVALEEALIEEAGLPIDFFQIRVADPSAIFSAGIFENLPTFVFGWEAWNEVFITVDAGIPSLSGTQFDETFGVSVEWRIDREWTLEGGVEPPIRRRLLRYFTLPASYGLGLDRQWYMDLRRRWTY
ncbi:MAG: translocation/assembly module TamB domain-containing protein [Longimicrobiales bacterium]